jgi:hypothetical protein
MLLHNVFEIHTILAIVMCTGTEEVIVLLAVRSCAH